MQSKWVIFAVTNNNNNRSLDETEMRLHVGADNTITLGNVHICAYARTSGDKKGPCNSVII